MGRRESVVSASAALFMVAVAAASAGDGAVATEVLAGADATRPGQGEPATVTAQRPRVEQSVEMSVPNAPVVLNVGGTRHLVHELHITNMRRQPLALRRLQVLAAGATIGVADLRGGALTQTLLRPGVARGGPDPEVVGPGQRIVSHLWIALATGAAALDVVTHRLELEVRDDNAKGMLEVEGASAMVSTAPTVALDAPLSGGPWVAIYDPLLMGGHRTAFYTLGGRARIPGRFAIDFIRPPGAVVEASPDQTDRRRNGFGADVLAVADARVATVMDDMPDNPLDARGPAQPLPLEQGSGNYVSLDLGNGRFAFYEHLQHKSIVVKVGDRVRSGQVIARLGSSGSTSIGPHLHFHVADSNATLAAEGQPFVFRQYEHRGDYGSLDDLLAGKPFAPAAVGRPAARRLEYPSPVAVVVF